MLRTFYAVPFIVSLACACASAPAKPSTDVPQSDVHATTVPAPVAEMTANTGPGEATRSRPVLGPGRCDDGFDCVDTVGFPASGYRWDCVNSKCERAKLPVIGGETQAVEPAATAENVKSKSKSHKSSKRNN